MNTPSTLPEALTEIERLNARVVELEELCREHSLIAETDPEIRGLMDKGFSRAQAIQHLAKPAPNPVGQFKTS